MSLVRDQLRIDRLVDCLRICHSNKLPVTIICATVLLSEILIEQLKSPCCGLSIRYDSVTFESYNPFHEIDNEMRNVVVMDFDLMDQRQLLHIKDSYPNAKCIVLLHS